MARCQDCYLATRGQTCSWFIAGNLSSVLRAMTLVPGPPAQLAVEPLRLFWLHSRLISWWAWPWPRVVSSRLPCLVLSDGVWLEQMLPDHRKLRERGTAVAGWLGHWPGHGFSSGGLEGDRLSRSYWHFTLSQGRTSDSLLTSVFGPAGIYFVLFFVTSARLKGRLSEPIGGNG